MESALNPFKYLMMRLFIFLLGLLLTVSCQKTSHEVPAMQDKLLCCVKPEDQKSGQAVVTPAENSLYQLSGSWQTATGTTMQLKQLSGKIQVVAMIFTHCGYACPRLVDNMRTIEASLDPSVGDEVGFVLISFDPARDSSAQLAEFARQKQLSPRWTLLRGSEGQVRELAVLLGLQYNPLPAGNFDHSNAITFLDEEGRIGQRLNGLNPQTDKATHWIEKMLSTR
jgi:protein SCO1/2